MSKEKVETTTFWAHNKKQTYLHGVGGDAGQGLVLTSTLLQFEVATGAVLGKDLVDLLRHLVRVQIQQFHVRRQQNRLHLENV